MIDFDITYDELSDITKVYGIGSVNKNVDLSPLLTKWYASLKTNPDYSVYGDDLYIAELWQCWRQYSRRHLLNIQKKTNLSTGSIVDDNSHARTIVDLGCGVGLTTALLRMIFPDSDIIGTNIDGAKQTLVAKHFAKQYDFDIVTDINKLPQTDLVFASEYFEHIIEPITHLNLLCSIMKPSKLLIANAFGTTAIGHFDQYDTITGKLYAKDTSKLFNKNLKNMGFTKVKTKLWNSRPSYWSKV